MNIVSIISFFTFKCSDDDFQKLFRALKKLKKDKTDLLDQLEDLRNFDSLRSPKKEGFLDKIKGIFM